MMLVVAADNGLGDAAVIGYVTDCDASPQIPRDRGVPQRMRGNVRKLCEIADGLKGGRDPQNGLTLKFNDAALADAEPVPTPHMSQ